MNSQPDRSEARKDDSAHNAAGGEDASASRFQAHDAGERPFTVRQSHSAGGVAYRKRTVDANSVIEVALIATDRSGRRWQLPKGRLYPSEKPLAAALREVEEETGLETVFESFLKTVNYKYMDTYARTVPERVYKRVDFYLLRAVGGVLSDASMEVQKVEWATPQEAQARLAYEGERDCIKLAMEHLHGY